MIVTVTPAPAVDWTVALGTVSLGAVNRGHTVAREASGKGVNVSIALQRNKVSSKAIVPLGGPTGDLFRALASAEQLDLVEVAIAAECRQNVTLREDSGQDTKVNLPGASMTSAEVDAMLGAVEHALQPGDLLVIAGSLPEGVPVSTFPRLIELGHRLGAKVAVDTSGEALSASLEQQPDFVKPNHHELGEELGREMATLGDVVAGCQALIDRGVGAVLASLGGHGAYYHDATTRLYGFVEGVTPVNSVGAGDGLLAGFIAHDSTPAESLARALAWGASAVQSPTTLFHVDREIGKRVSVTDQFDPLLALT